MTTNSISFERILTGIVTLFSGTMGSRVLSATALVIMGRQLDPKAFGQYSSSMALVALTSASFVLGLDGWLLHKGGQRSDQLALRFSSALILKGSLGVLWFGGLWLFVAFLKPTAFPRSLVIAGAVTIWFEELARVAWSALKVNLRNKLVSGLMIGLRAIFLGIVLWLAFQDVRDPVAYLSGRMIAAIVVGVFSVIAVARYLRLHISISRVRQTLYDTLPYAFSLMLALLYARADLTIVAYVLGTGGSSVYGPAVTLMSALFLVPAAIFDVMVPILSKEFVQSQSWVSQLARWLLILAGTSGVIMGGTLSVLSKTAITLIYGEAYIASAPILAVLAIVLAIRFLSAATASLLVAIGYQMFRVKVQAVSAILNVVLNVLFVRRLGVLGVAWIYVLSEAILCSGYLGVFLLWVRGRKPSKTTVFES
jgi:O-antigen/teichoic acid export membrane protein